jgi:hypothetical protein
VLLALCERAWRDREVIRFLLLGVAGIAAAVFSGTVVLERIAHSQAARLSASRTDNLPKAEAQKALDEAKKSLEKAEAEARDECRSGRKLRCEATELREKAARDRVAEARTRLVSLGAASSETPVASVLGEWTETYHRVMPLALPMWLELTAPIVLAYGFAPAPHKEPEPSRPKAKRRKKKRPPRKPPAKPALRVVND